MKNKTLLPLLGTLLLTAATAQAELIVYESFDYAASTSNPDADASSGQANGLPYTNVGGNPSGTGTGLRNNWLGTVASGSLSYSNLASSGNSLSIQANVEPNPATVWIYRSMSTDPYAAYRSENSANWFGADGQTVWGSILVNVGSIASSSRFQLRLEGQDGSAYTQIRITAGDGNANWSLQNTNTSAGADPASSVTVNSAVAATAGTPTLLLWQHTFGTGATSTGQDTFNLWINPNLSNPLGTANYSLTTGAEVGFSGVGYDTRTNTGSSIDELRIGTTFESVSPIPEPGTIALVGIALGSLLLFRRRR